MNVPKEKLNKAASWIENQIQKVVDDGSRKFDMEIMAITKDLYETEKEQHKKIFKKCALDLLVNYKENELKCFLSAEHMYQKLAQKNSSYWLDIIQEIFVKSQKSIIIRKPSKERHKMFLKERKQRRVVSIKKD